MLIQEMRNKVTTKVSPPLHTFVIIRMFMFRYSLALSFPVWYEYRWFAYGFRGNFIS